jgi:hypothetical protein
VNKSIYRFVRAEIDRLDKELDPWTKPTARGKMRITAYDPEVQFSIKCVGVFDTVG